ncbi:MAG: multifunctional CCA addition/repair protein [Rhodocyclaceae bacterium]|nr:multifunctional CCA addition/repair protein [Rhodocyclaceae bacterium]MBK6554889.1 multifunctional CCA addition/repair protein [Rhodocyclaceae bacterium]MBK9309831.1 multifunctional CCA addition/repair protein [Rhodocyclaceae bacterium]MBK9953606.1 multifunctional CCA addition/repair protein [Rhodocyclaceae bacterium]
MKVFAVGGAVRDELLGLPVRDRDWVVVGATPEQMAARGFRAVGKDFPVFLHPETHEEYALARTERKTAPGYKGFVFHADADVTIEEDLARRDLTINAIAKAEDDGYIDPFNGRADLAAKVLRHVSPAFAEDPVRVLRVARFAARFHDFTVAGETVALMRALVAAGEVDHLVAERVWQELARGLMEAKPSRMFELLRQCGALRKLLPELDRLWGVPQRADYHPEIDTGTHVMMVIDMAARLNLALPARFAALTHDLGKGTTPADVLPRHIGHEQRSVSLLGPVCERLRVPADCCNLALLVARYHGDMYKIDQLRAKTVVTILERCDVFRRPERFEELLGACEADYRGRLGFEERAFTQSQWWRCAVAAARGVDAGAVAAGCADPARIPARIHEARAAAVAAALQQPEQ